MRFAHREEGCAVSVSDGQETLKLVTQLSSLLTSNNHHSISPRGVTTLHLVLPSQNNIAYLKLNTRELIHQQSRDEQCNGLSNSSDSVILHKSAFKRVPIYFE